MSEPQFVSDAFTERLCLHQLATHQSLRLRPILQTLRGARVRLVQGWVMGINPGGRET